MRQSRREFFAGAVAVGAAAILPEIAGAQKNTKPASIVLVHGAWLGKVKWKDLDGIVLVGHSFGGIVITGAAEKLRWKIAAIVYVDAFIPLDGQSMESLRNNSGVPLPVPTVPSPPAAYFKVNAADADWVGSKATPHPTKCFTEPVHVTDAYQKIAKKVYIRAPAFKQAAFDTAYGRCRADSTWKTHEMPCGHDIMLDMPAELTAIIESVA